MLARAIDLIRYASDASPYRRLPAVVVMAHDAADVAKVLGYARAQRHPGQLPRRRHEPQRAGQTDGIMIDVRRWFSGVRIEDGGARARMQGGDAARSRQQAARSATAASSAPTPRAKTSRRSAA